jgi:formylglycine-generating enzyme required for sulfatase activity
VFDSGWLEKGSGVVERAGQMRLPVILAIPPKMREGIEEKLFPFIEKHRDVVMGVGWRSPYYQGYLAEHVEEFGRALKARFPGLQYWVTNVSKPRGKHETQPIPDSVDVIVVDDYFSTTPDKLLQGTADYLPGWLWKARGRPVLLEWTSWEAKPTRIVDRIDPATMRACFDIAKEYRLAGLLFWKYGPETDTANEGTPGLESSLGLVKEIQQGAEEVGVVKQRASLRASAKSGSTTPPAVQTPATTAPPLAIAPFDEKKAKEHQEAWAKHLGVPVEITNSIGMKLVLIPPGEFDMGSTDDEIARLVDEAKHRKLATWVLRTLPSETPRHRVRISRAFYLGQYEVTQDQFRRMMSYNPSKNKGSGTEAPVEEISWGEAVAFCGQLSELAVEKSAGGAYRLTTEAEWEYACRAGTTTAYCFGDDEAGVSEFAWWQQNADERTHPVGEKRPNHFGLYDMHGNVAEWCSDWYSSDYYSQSPDVDPTGPAAGENRVLRGLSYRDPHPLLLRSACRIWRSPASRFHHYGFRVVKTITP